MPIKNNYSNEIPDAVILTTMENAKHRIQNAALVLKAWMACGRALSSCTYRISIPLSVLVNDVIC